MNAPQQGHAKRLGIVAFFYSFPSLFRRTRFFFLRLACLYTPVCYSTALGKYIRPQKGRRERSPPGGRRHVAELFQSIQTLVPSALALIAWRRQRLPCPFGPQQKSLSFPFSWLTQTPAPPKRSAGKEGGSTEGRIRETHLVRQLTSFPREVEAI